MRMLSSAEHDELLAARAERDQLRTDLASAMAVLRKLRRGDLHQRVRPLFEEAQAVIATVDKPSRSPA